MKNKPKTIEEKVVFPKTVHDSLKVIAKREKTTTKKLVGNVINAWLFGTLEESEKKRK